MNYYNEIDPKAAQWLRLLISNGLIPLGVVDERSIVDVSPDELRGFTQCHFFAGIGGWSQALKLAQWPSDRPVWTGSCPCQPFSNAGQRNGFDDERHLWPFWHHLIRECKPPVVFGEQVASALSWIDLVQSDMEGEGYSFAKFDLCAAGFGAPHIRQRLWFVSERLDNPISEGLQGYSGDGSSKEGWEGQTRPTSKTSLPNRVEQPYEVKSFWGDADWLFCRDGNWRPVRPGSFPLANGVPGRVALLRGFGNAIVPQVAAEVIKSYMEYSDE